jgi:hypothetical protein
MKTENEMYQTLRQILEHGDYSQACALITRQKKSEWGKWAEYLVHHSPVPLVVYVGFFQKDPSEKFHQNEEGYEYTKMEVVKILQIQTHEDPFHRMGAILFGKSTLAMSENLTCNVWFQPHKWSQWHEWCFQHLMMFHHVEDEEVKAIIKKNHDSHESAKAASPEAKIDIIALMHSRYVETFGGQYHGNIIPTFY